MVDAADGVREPLGMSGVRLEVEVHVVTAAVTSVQNVIRSVNRAGLTVQDVVLEPTASAEAVLYPDEKELGAVVIDMGGGATDPLPLPYAADPRTAILPPGGDPVKNDVPVVLRPPTAGTGMGAARCGAGREGPPGAGPATPGGALGGGGRRRAGWVGEVLEGSPVPRERAGATLRGGGHRHRQRTDAAGQGPRA